MPSDLIRGCFAVFRRCFAIERDRVSATAPTDADEVPQAAPPCNGDLVAGKSTVSTASLIGSGERFVQFRLDSGWSHAQYDLVAGPF